MTSRLRRRTKAWGNRPGPGGPWRALGRWVLLAAVGLPLSAWAAPVAANPPGVRPGDPLSATVDWSVAGEEATRLLQGLLRADTTNPPGTETQGALYLAAWLAREGISSEILEHAPGRGSLLARLPATTDPPAGPPICLLSHLDVATAEPNRWPAGKGPLSGTLDEDGMLWGRGALDMKGLTALQAMTLALLARTGTPRGRELLLIAVADEEVGNRGIDHVLETSWDRIGCSHALNEGGLGVEDMLVEGQDIYTVSVGEKGALWARIVATGEPGHGSVPQAGQSPERLFAAVEALRAHTERPQIHASFLELFAAAGAHAGGLPGWVLQRPGLVRLLLMKRLKGNPLTLAVMTNTLNPTGYGGAAEPNVVPSESWANLDARLLPGTNPDAFLAKLGSIIDDERIRIDVTSLVESNVSPWTGDPLYEALVTRAVEGKPEAVAGPVLSPGYTDSAPLRALGVRAYGFLPVMMGEPQIVTMHGDNERISVAQITDGLRVLALALADVVAQAGTTRPQPEPIAWPTDWPFSTEGLVVPPLPPRGARLTDDPRWDEPVVLDVSSDESKARSIRDPSAAQELPQTPPAN